MGEIIEDPETSGSPFVIIDPKEKEYPVIGIFGDIGFLLDPNTGLPIQGRTITASYRIRTLADMTQETPGKKWKVRAPDLYGTDCTLYVVRYEPDRTIGMARIKLAVNYNE
jgi:hypothetical protein